MLASEVAARNYDKTKDWVGSDQSDAARTLRQQFNESNPDWPSRPNLVLLERISSLNMERLKGRFDQEGITENSLRSPAWNILTNLQYAKKIKNLRDEFGAQQEKMKNQDHNFGPGTLIGGHSDPGDDFRYGLPWIGSPTEFYRQLMPLTTLTDTDRIAFTLETNDQVIITAINLYCLDHGVDLHDFNLNLRQESLNFHDYMERAITNYLGITAPAPDTLPGQN